MLPIILKDYIGVGEVKMKLNSIIKKYYEYGLTKLKVLKNQRCFRYDNIDLKYMYRSVKDAKVLVIVFSACTRVGLRARYNYVKTLENMHCNCLFILDDFCSDKRGSFYLGRIPEFKEQEATIALINKIIKETNPNKTIFCGSCKGGYAALNFGCRFENAIMIIGEPTYRIATEFCLSEPMMYHWMGEVTEEKIKLLDYYLSEQLKQRVDLSNRIHFFYSDCDEYFIRHTQPLLCDLYKYGYKVAEERAKFKEHSDLSIYFPHFLKKSIDEYL